MASEACVVRCAGGNHGYKYCASDWGQFSRGNLL